MDTISEPLPARAVPLETLLDYYRPMPDKLISVAVSDLHPSPDNPGRDFGDIPALAETIQAQGLIEPPVVRKRDGGGYWIVAGERRWRALKHLGTKKVDAILREYTREEALAVTIIENKDRESFSPIELARGYQQMLDMGQTQEQVAQRLGVGKSTVFAATSLLRLPEVAQTAISQGKLPADGARAIASLKGERLQLAAFHDAMKLTKPGEKGPSSRAVIRMVQQKYITTAKRGLTKAQREARTHGADVALRRRVLERLVTRAREIIDRRPHLDETDLRAMALARAEAGGDAVREVFARRGVHVGKMGKVTGRELRALVWELDVAPAMVLEDGEFGPFAKAMAKAYGLSLKEMESTIEAEGAAEALFAKEK
jgi:ParB family chromosome partitioning protein